MSNQPAVAPQLEPARGQGILARIGLRPLLWLFALTFVLHELEEWNVLAWHRRYQTGVPAEMTDLDLRAFFVAFSLAIVLLTFLVLRLRGDRLVAYLMLPLLTLNFYNGVVHFAWTLRYHSYAPGLVFGFLVGAPLTGLIVYRMLARRLVKGWVVVAVAAVNVLLIGQALALGDVLDPSIVTGMRLGRQIARALAL